MSIRLRLTLLYTAILALALIVASVLLFATQSQLTLDIVKHNLTRQADSFVKGPRFTGYTQATLPGRWTQVRSLDGAVVGHTMDLDTSLPLSNDGLESVQGGTGWFETVTLEGEPLLIYSIRVDGRDGTNRILQVATPIAERAESLQTLGLVLLVGNGLVIAAALALSWFVGGTALRPIQRITKTAQAIGAERSFSRRVAYSGPNDEVGHLATTFNTMLTELESAYQQLQGLLESQRRFVADASHELRTPLTTIRGNIELLHHESNLPQERDEILADTQDEVERLIRLVQQLLTLARADAGQAVRREPILVQPVLDDVCRQMKLLAATREIECSVPANSGVLGDRDAFKQVLVILLDNAIKHTAPSAKISVTVTKQNEHVELDVRDTGKGIPPEKLPQLFERFYRGDGARSGHGTGLGLAIAQELTQLQQGTLTVQSRIGEGSVFTLTLPRA